MTHYGVAYRGKHINVETRIDARTDDVHCRVAIDSQACPTFRGSPFRTESAARLAGASFGRAMVDAWIDGDSIEHQGYFIRPSSNEQRDGSWVGTYQFHRNDNPVPFRRVVCDDLRANTRVEAEEHALALAKAALDADVASGRL